MKTGVYILLAAEWCCISTCTYLPAQSYSKSLGDTSCEKRALRLYCSNFSHCCINFFITRTTHSTLSVQVLLRSHFRSCNQLHLQKKNNPHAFEALYNKTNLRNYGCQVCRATEVTAKAMSAFLHLKKAKVRKTRTTNTEKVLHDNKYIRMHEKKAHFVLMHLHRTTVLQYRHWALLRQLTLNHKMPQQRNATTSNGDLPDRSAISIFHQWQMKIW